MTADDSEGGESVQQRSQVKVVVADPQGSGLYNRVNSGVMYSSTEAEGTRRRHQVDSVVEGIGMNRLTRNLERGLEHLDGAEKVTDDEAVRMSRHLAKHDGLFIGPSTAVHCVAAVKTARKMKQARSPATDGEGGNIQNLHKDEATMYMSDPALMNMARPVVVTILCVAQIKYKTHTQRRFWHAVSVEFPQRRAHEGQRLPRRT